MGRRLDNGALDDFVIRNGLFVVKKMVRAAEEMGAIPRLVGTMALRSAKNAEEFIRQVRKQTGVTVEILSEEEEAYLSWLGAVHSLKAREGNIAVFDIGGGSTEFIISSDSRIAHSRSVSVGTVSLTEKFYTSDPAGPDAVEDAIRYARDAFKVADGLAASPGISAVGLGGGVLALASVKRKFPSFIPPELNGTLLTRADIAEQRELYASMTLPERAKIQGLPPRRADIVLAGACLAQCALDALRADSFRVSINGLRHGLLMKMFGAVGKSAGGAAAWT
jgi:exopolyphosphatase/guanosine-5'-triphosphate,3'-diphosphate pyrophosphatase